METLLTKLLVPLIAVLGVSALCILMLLVDYLRTRSRGDDDVEVPSRSPSWARQSSLLDDDGPHDTLVIDRKAMHDSYPGNMPMDTRAVTDFDAPRRSPEPPAPQAPPRSTDSLRLADLRRQQEAQARATDSPGATEPQGLRDTPRPAPRPDPMRRSGEFSRSDAYRSPEPPRNVAPPQRLSDSGRQERPVPPSRPPEPPRTGMPTRASLDPRDPRRSGEFTRSSLSGDSTGSGAFRRPPAPPPLQPVGSNIVLNQPQSQAGYMQLPGKIDIIYGNFSPSDPREIAFLWAASDNTPPRYTFSKSPGEGVSHIQLNHYTITSGTQAELRFLDGKPVLVNLIEPEDMERYQTRVNGIPLGPGESNTLSSGDIISMGIYRLKLSL